MSNRQRTLITVLLAIMLVLAAGAWFWASRGAPRSPDVADAIAVPAATIDRANEERRVTVSGMLEIEAGAVDNELDVASAAALLFRDVEMYQWQESCLANGCGQGMVWSATRIDSSQFREQAGNANPVGFPFANARFAAQAIRLGRFTVDPDLVAQLPTQPRPVWVSDLQPNLAAIFRDADGSLFSGDDIGHPKLGDLRVSYREVPLGEVTLTGVQRGDHLVAATAAH